MGVLKSFWYILSKIIIKRPRGRIRGPTANYPKRIVVSRPALYELS